MPIACLRCGQTRIMRRAGVHLTSTTNLPQILYKGIQHGEGGGLPFPVLYREGLPSHADFCDAASAEKAEETQQLLQNDPRYWIRHEGRPLPLPRSAPDRNTLEHCLIPWVIL